MIFRTYSVAGEVKPMATLPRGPGAWSRVSALASSPVGDLFHHHQLADVVVADGRIMLTTGANRHQPVQVFHQFVIARLGDVKVGQGR